MQVDNPGNKLLVNASPKKIADIIQVVESIDVPAIQIMLETRLIEVAADVEEQLGIDWSKISSYKTILAEGVPSLFEVANASALGSFISVFFASLNHSLKSSIGFSKSLKHLSRPNEFF